MKRPLLIIAISYVLGIIIGVYFKKSIPFIMLGVLIICLVTAKRNRKIKKTIIVIVVVMISAIRTIQINNEYEKFYEKFDNEKITAVATVCGDIEETEYRYTTTVKINKMEGDTKDIYKNKKFLLYVKKSRKTKLKYGQQIKIIGFYDKTEGRRNYKGSNYQEYLKNKKIYGMLNCEDELKIIKDNNINPISMLIYRVRDKLKNNVFDILDKDEAGLATGILLGDSSEIEDDIKEDFKNCSLSHMLAVSGAHLSYLILGLNLLLNDRIIGKRKKYVINIIAIIIFMLLTGMSLSVIRAGISTILSIVAVLIYRKSDSFETMAFALLCTIIDNPFTIFNMGLQLSYLGTAGIVLLNKYLVEFEKKHTELSKIKVYLIENTYVTLSATLLIFPIILYYFNMISLNLLLANLLLGPILGVSIMLGFIVLSVSLISMPVAQILGWIWQLPLKFITKATAVIAKLPMANITVVTPRNITIAAIYIIIALLIVFMKNKKQIIIKKIIPIVISVTLILNFTADINWKGDLKIYFVDVGQGDSTYICTPKGTKILIDGGGSREPEKYDVGKKILLPYILDRRVKKIDYIIVSHFDSDHCQGLEQVLQTIKVKNIIIGKQASICKEFEKIMDICSRKKINVIKVKRGGKVEIDKSLYFEILHPSDKMLDDGKGGLNANAIVAKMYYKPKNGKKFTMLFTGDIEKDAEKELVKEYGKKLKVDILKVAHHGSKTSSIEEFLKLAMPETALIGVGQRNTFGHPNEGVLQRLKEINAKIYRTDLNGEITVTVDKKGNYKIQVMKD